MARSLPSRSLTAVLALMLSMIALATLMALPPGSMARARRVACPSSSPARARHRPHACTHSVGTSKASAKPRSHARRTAKGHLNASKKTTAPRNGSAATTTTAAAGGAQVPATCEDGSGPVREGEGMFSCDDESEPGCKDGSRPVPSSDGSILVCGVATRGAGPSEAGCEGADAPPGAGDVSFSCEDGSEPTCEDGSEPARASARSHCDVVSWDESAR